MRKHNLSINISELPNGIRIVTHSLEQLYTASLSFQMDVGSRDEREEQNGLSHLLEHMAFKGTNSRSAHQISQQIESVGGDLNASTSVETTSYYTRVLNENIDLGFEIIADILTDAKIDPKDLQKEQHVILQEIGAAHDTPDDVVFDHALEIAFQDQAIGRPILGTIDRVKSFDKNAVRDYLSEHYIGSSMVISAAGGVQHDEILNLAEKFLGDYPARKRVERRKAIYQGGEFLDIKELEQIHLILGFEGLSIYDKDIYVLQVLTSILGGGMSSRLFQQIREDHGLCYSIYSFHWTFQDSGFFGIYGATGEEDTKALMPMILDVVLSMIDHIDEEELSKARAQVKTSLLMTLENSMARAEQIARHVQLFGYVRSTQEILEKINTVTKADVKRVSERIFKSSSPTLCAIGPAEHLMRLDEIKSYLNQ